MIPDMTFEQFRRIAPAVEHLARCLIYIVIGDAAYRPKGGWR